MKTSVLFLAGALLLVGACGKSPAGVEDDATEGVPSTVSFSFGGSGAEAVLSGSHQVSGDPDLGRPPRGQTFADGRRIRRAGVLSVGTNMRRSENLSDFASVVIPQLSPGPVAIDESCGREYCPGVFVALELSNAHGSQAKYSCTLKTGTVRITSISEQRARGEFSGTGFCVGAAGTADLDQFSVSNGRFDVKLRDVQS